MHQVCFVAFAQHIVCPPPPASANGSVPSLPAPAEPGVGVDTPRFDGLFVPRRCANVRHMQGGWDSEWWADWQLDGCSLDAPDLLPSGSHCAFGSCDRVYADGYAGYRP